MNDHAGSKSSTVAYLLWFFLGSFGAHRFYMGRTGSGLGMAGLFAASAIGTLVLVGLLGFVALFAWWLVDAFLIPKWMEQEQLGAGVAPDVVEPTIPAQRAA